MGNMTATSQELLERLAEEACSRREIHEKLPTVAWALTVAGCLPDSLLRKVLPCPRDLHRLKLSSWI